MHEGSKRAIFAAFLANLGIAIAKFVGFLITGASSMLAESIHSVADTANQGLLFLGGRQAARPATPEHPFGYGRDRYFWSFVVALVLFSVGGLFAIYEGIEKIRHPHDIDSPAVAFVDPRRRGGARGVLAAHGGARSRTTSAARSAGSRSSAAPRRPSCRWCCWRTSARCSACSSP